MFHEFLHIIAFIANDDKFIKSESDFKKIPYMKYLKDSQNKIYIMGHFQS